MFAMEKIAQISCLMDYWSYSIYNRVKLSTTTNLLLIYKLSCTQILKELKSGSHINFLGSIW